MEVLLGGSPVKSKRRFFKKKEHAVLQKCSAVYPKSPQLAPDSRRCSAFCSIFKWTSLKLQDPRGPRDLFNNANTVLYRLLWWEAVFVFFFALLGETDPGEGLTFIYLKAVGNGECYFPSPSSVTAQPTCKQQELCNSIPVPSSEFNHVSRGTFFSSVFIYYFITSRLVVLDYIIIMMATKSSHSPKTSGLN